MKNPNFLSGILLLVVALRRSDHNLPDMTARLQILVSFPKLIERECPVDDRLDVTCL